MKALLFCVEKIWNLEPIGILGTPRTFATARAAREWARRNNITVVRKQNCDS